MTRRWIVRPLAQADIDDAVTWYEQRQSGLGSRFLDVLDDAFTRIRDTPLQFPTISADVRRALLHTFPCALYFRETEQAVTILAVLHLHRDPRIWRRRS
jgi:plasmid stabilization system protein ParE